MLQRILGIVGSQDGGLQSLQGHRTARRSIDHRAVRDPAAAVDDHTANGGAVAPDELGGRMEHDVGAVLDRPAQEGRGEGVVDDQRDPRLVGDFGDRRLAQRSQYPMLALMVGYTVLSLWIIAQPIVN